MAASIAAVYPHMNHIGGDGFWLVREPNGRVRALMAPGPAGAKATIPFYRERGYDTIPARGPLAALTVPGAIGGWMLALEAAKSLGGKMPLDILLAPAIKQARDGYVVTRSQHALTREQRRHLFDPAHRDAALPRHGRQVGRHQPTGRDGLLQRVAHGTVGVIDDHPV